MKKTIFILLLLCLPALGWSQDATIRSGKKLVVDYVNDLCSNYLSGDVSDKYFDPEYAAVGGDTFDILVVDRAFKISEAKIIKRPINDYDNNTSQIEEVLQVKVLFHEIGYFKSKDEFVKDNEIHPFIYYLSKKTGKYLIVDSDDNDQVICFYDSLLKCLKENMGPVHWEDPKPIIKSLKTAKTI